MVIIEAPSEDWSCCSSSAMREPTFSRFSPSQRRGGEMFCDTLDKIAGRWDTSCVPRTKGWEKK